MTVMIALQIQTCGLCVHPATLAEFHLFPNQGDIFYRDNLELYSAYLKSINQSHMFLKTSSQLIATHQCGQTWKLRCILVGHQNSFKFRGHEMI